MKTSPTGYFLFLVPNAKFLTKILVKSSRIRRQIVYRSMRLFWATLHRAYVSASHPACGMTEQISRLAISFRFSLKVWIATIVTT